MNITALVALLACVCIGYIEARGGRGGGARGGRYGGRSYRSSGSRSSRYRSAYSSYRLGSRSTVRNALLLGTVYGATRWRLRRPNYHYDDNDLPQICYNDKYKQNAYGNVSYYGRFICPEDHQDDDYNYCCGEEGLQYCCSFWEDGGRVAGVVIGILLAVAAVVVFFVCLFCFCKKRSARHGSRSTPGVTWRSSQPENTFKTPMPTTDYSSPQYTYPQTTTTGVQPPPYPAESAPPYSTNGYSTPYPPEQSNGYSSPYPSEQTNGYSAPYPPEQNNGYGAPYPTKQNPN